MANDEKIIRQLPKFLQCQYPAYLTQRGGLSKVVGDMLRPLIQNSVGPKRFHKLLVKLHTLKHSRSEFQYLNSAAFLKENPTIKMMLKPNKNILPFSSFNDAKGYAGYVPSAQYLRSFYTTYTEEIRHLLNKQMMVLDASYLKGDHSFKIIKLMGKVDGTPTFTALYTVLNEYEEVRVQFLVPTKSISHLKYAFDALRRSLDLYGHSQPQIFFTDNVRGDKNLLESVFPSLKSDVKPVDKPEPGTVIDNSKYPKLMIPGDQVQIRCFQEADDMEAAAKDLLDQVEVEGTNKKKELVVGFDCEWPVIEGYGPGRIGTIQIATSRNIDIYCLGQIHKLPPSLNEVLSSSKIIKVGRKVQEDLKKIERDFSVSCRGAYDVAALCKERGLISTQRISLSDICSRVLERFLPKDDNVRCSDWSNIFGLSTAQKEYAALDAWAGLEIYNKVKQKQVRSRKEDKKSL